MFRCQSCGALNRLPASPPPGAAICGRCKTALDVSGTPQEVDAAGFARAIASSPVPVLVDFWAPWCGPCRVAGPVLEQVAREHAGRVIALKLNTDESPQVATEYGIRGVPTFILFSAGRELSRRVGLVPREALAEWVSTV